MTKKRVRESHLTFNSRELKVFLICLFFVLLIRKIYDPHCLRNYRLSYSGRSNWLKRQRNCIFKFRL